MPVEPIIPLVEGEYVVGACPSSPYDNGLIVVTNAGRMYKVWQYGDWKVEALKKSTR